MGRRFEVMVRENSQPPFLINIAWVCMDLREIGHEAMVLQNGLDEESVGITNNPQLTSESRTT